MRTLSPVSLKSALVLTLLASGLILCQVSQAALEPGVPASTNVIEKPSSPVSVKISDDDDDDDTAPAKAHGHGARIEIHSDHESSDSSLEDWLIPIVAILSAFGTPIIIVLLVCYFKFRRRRENLAMAREYLNKGLPVPPQLIDGSSNPWSDLPMPVPVARQRSDLRKGFKYTFIGLAVSVALFVHDPNSRSWAWGLIPMIIGIGFLLSGWIESRYPAPNDETKTPPPSSPL